MDVISGTTIFPAQLQSPIAVFFAVFDRAVAAVINTIVSVILAVLALVSVSCIIGANNTLCNIHVIKIWLYVGITKFFVSSVHYRKKKCCKTKLERNKCKKHSDSFSFIKGCTVYIPIENTVKLVICQGRNDKQLFAPFSHFTLYSLDIVEVIKCISVKSNLTDSTLQYL